MSRKTRMYLPGIPAHVVQRGHNRSSCFFADDYQFYHEGLGQGLHRYIEPNPVAAGIVPRLGENQRLDRGP